MKIIMLGNDTKEEIEKRLRIVATAGNLSRADGTVTQVYETNNDYENNLRLARAIVGYGHKSISEHDYLVFALEDVTPIVEQTIIGYRLTSFTIKSRRNVDFRNVGFYTPDFKDNDGNIVEKNAYLQNIYKNYMNSLFKKYGELVDEGLPVEDCRYILPYSYHSNIIMGCDANELLNMTSDMLYGKISNISEIHELGEKLAEMIITKAPYLSRALDKEAKKDYYEDKLSFLDKEVQIDNNDYQLLNEVKMIDYTNNADWKVLVLAMMARYQYSYEKAEETLRELCKQDPETERNIMQAIIHKKNQRELEQVIYSFQMPISLAVLTHITRHRMHSLLVPDFVPMWNLDNFITPESIKTNHKNEFNDIFANNKTVKDMFKSFGIRDEDLVYFYLSGNACNITTTMNARTLEWISRMRCCNKAQWEIRELANQMVDYAKGVSPLIGEGLGPNCKVNGFCPEGKDSCKERGVVVFKKEMK